MNEASLSDLLDLSKKVALVTGAGRGIGQAIARRLAEAGAAVIICDINAESGAETVALIEGQGGRSRAVKMDVSQVSDISKGVQTAIEAFGDLHIVVNNAALFPPTMTLQITEAEWEKVIDVNLKGTFFVAQTAARTMIERGHGGSIINIASLGYRIPPGMLSHYDASKGGVVSLTQSMAKELGPHGIRVNAIAPGHMVTPGAAEASVRISSTLKIPLPDLPIRSVLGRYGNGDDVAKAAYFLATDLAGYVTGSVIDVGGGYHLH